MRGRTVFGPWSLAALALAHAVAIVLVSHWHYAFTPPTRQGWFWLELGVAAAAWLPCAAYLTAVRRRIRDSERRALTTAALVLGVLAAVWLTSAFETDYWVHKPVVRAALEPLRAIAFVVVLTAGFAGLLAVTVAATRSDTPDPIPSPSSPGGWRIIVGLVLFVTAANAFVVWYVGQERTVYYWDYMAYWSRAGDLAGLLRDGTPSEMWEAIRRGTQLGDYGPLPALPPAIAAAQFGDTRLVYVLTIATLYLTGVATAAWMFVRRAVPEGGWLTIALPLVLTGLSTVAWAPLLRGYLDVGGAAFGILALTVYLGRPAGRLRWRDVLILAGLLAAMALFRRWYSFFVVAFAVIAGADTGRVVLRTWAASGWRDAADRICPLALVGVWVVVILAVAAPDWVRRAATTNYADLYAAYKTPHTTAERTWGVIARCGPAAWAFAAIAFAILLAFRDTRRATLVIGLMPPIMLFHFQRTQNLDPHHFSLFLPALVLLPAMAGCRIFGSAPVWGTAPIVALITAASGVVFAATFVPELASLHARLWPATPSWAVTPLVRSDLSEFTRMLTSADATAVEGNRLVAVVASSPTLNPTLLMCADRSLGRPVFDARHVIYTSEVDRTAEFPVGYFSADVLLVADPPQTHLRGEEQQVVVAAAERLLSGRGFGAAFERLPGAHHLEGGVTVYLFRRVRPISAASRDEFCEHLRAAHPRSTRLYTPPPDIDLHLSYPRVPGWSSPN